MQRRAALMSRPDTLLDHLGVLAAMLEMPLFIPEQTTFDLATTFYPNLNGVLMDSADMTLEFLAKNFDVLFVSSKLWAIELCQAFPLFCNKKMRIVYCPHGNSDKGHALTKELLAPEDISLVYGDHMLDLLKHNGMLEQTQQTIVTGNYRHAFFLQHQAFYETLVERAIFAKLDRRKKTILYAPTWEGKENASSFYSDCEALLQGMPSSFNLLVKLHPYLWERSPVETIRITERYKDHPQVLFLEEFPPIYPILSIADAYLGDFSSIGYDFLTFDKSMYFFNPSNADLQKDRGLFLHRCGMQVSTKGEENVFDFIERTWEQNRAQFSTLRQQVYRYTFGNGEERFRQELSTIFVG